MRTSNIETFAAILTHCRGNVKAETNKFRHMPCVLRPRKNKSSCIPVFGSSHKGSKIGSFFGFRTCKAMRTLIEYFFRLYKYPFNTFGSNYPANGKPLKKSVRISSGDSFIKKRGRISSKRTQRKRRPAISGNVWPATAAGRRRQPSSAGWRSCWRSLFPC